MSRAEAGQMRSDARRNRERLLAAALAAFAERGADDTSLEAIARRAGVGIGTLYRHFPTRQSLLEAVYRDQVEALSERAASPPAQASARAALTSWLRALVTFSLTKRNLTAGLLAGSDGDGNKDAIAAKDSALFTASREKIHAAASSLLDRAKEAGEVRQDIEVSDLLRLTHAVMAATDRLPDQAGEADRLLDIVLGGVWQPSPEQSAVH
jgi:AcrR family transcriptional regulator